MPGEIRYIGPGGVDSDEVTIQLRGEVFRAFEALVFRHTPRTPEAVLQAVFGIALAVDRTIDAGGKVVMHRRDGAYELDWPWADEEGR